MSYVSIKGWFLFPDCRISCLCRQHLVPTSRVSRLRVCKQDTGLLAFDRKNIQIINMTEVQKQLHVGLVGAGLGGLAAAIAIARGGAKVTVLEAASQLGEIGAGIQMTPNVARLLIRWGVSDIIGDDLVQCDEVNMRNMDGRIVGYTDLKKTVRDYGYPWYVTSYENLLNDRSRLQYSTGG